MALTISPVFPPPANAAPYAIDSEWCIGDSLPYINENFANFDSRILSLANTNNGLTTLLNTLTGNLATLISTLSNAYTSTRQGIATAWVNFKGTDLLIGSNALIYSSYNVASVTRLSDFTAHGTSGYVFQITFSTPMLNDNYAVVGTGTIGGSTVNGDDQIVGMTGRLSNTVTGFQIGVCDSQQRPSTESAEIISVAVYGGK